MKIKLKDVATIQTGIFGQSVPVGNVAYLQARHFDDAGELISTMHLDFRMDDLESKHVLRPGDVLFATKGAKTFAAVYESKNLPAVASTSFFVIRLTGTSAMPILPKYLAWFINHPRTQSLLKGQATGTSIASIRKPVIEELEIPVPSIEIQTTVLEISKLREKERKIQLQVEALRELLIQEQIIAAISKTDTF